MQWAEAERVVREWKATRVACLVVVRLVGEHLRCERALRTLLQQLDETYLSSCCRDVTSENTSARCFLSFTLFVLAGMLATAVAHTSC